MTAETTKYWTQTRSQPVDLAIADLAEHQHGVVSGAQLRDLGLAASTVRSRVGTGRLHRLHRGVFAVGRRDVSRRGALARCCIGVRAGALLSRRSVLELRGALPSSGRRPEVTVPRKGCARVGIDVHSSRTLTGADRAIVDGIPCTGVARTLLDVAATASPRELARAVEELERLRP